MRAVIDTNVLISGLLWHGVPRRLIDHIRSGTALNYFLTAVSTTFDRAFREK